MGNPGVDRWDPHSFALQITSGSLGTEEITTSFWEGRGSSVWFLVIGLKVRLHKILDFQISKRTLELYVPKLASASP